MLHTHVIFYVYPKGDRQAKNPFNISWKRVQTYYHRFNNLDEFLIGDLAKKGVQVILSCYLMYRECNCSLPSKVNRKRGYEGKPRKNV